MTEVKWSGAEDYPDINSLALSYRQRSNEILKTLLEYAVATAVFAVALYAVSGEWMVLAGGAAFLVAECLWMLGRRHTYARVATAIDRGGFTWTTGKLESKFKRGWFDISSGPAYQMKCLGEWREADMASYNECTVGKPIVLLDLGERMVCAPIPKGCGWKNLKSMARAQERKAATAPSMSS